MSSTRQLAAIMFTDIVGYTALMGTDEQRAFEILHKNRELQRPLIEQYNGRWIKELGDGVLASFPTASEAVLCATEIQKQCNASPDFKLRIGIHLGEVVFDEGDVFGDGVNIASRLQTLAPIGGIWVSEAVHLNVVNKQEIHTKYIREEKLKNVQVPVRIYEVEQEGSIATQHRTKGTLQASTNKRAMSLGKPILIAVAVVILAVLGYFIYTGAGQKKVNSIEVNEAQRIDKSIAVLPFTNMSNDPEQEYFANGMMDEILNHLFKIGGWRVISRTSAMTYKGTKKTMKEIAKELGVANLLEGSVQKQGNHIRVIVQLINGKTDEHLWSESYDREFKDVFAIQSDIAQNVANAIKVTITPEVKSRIERLPTKSTEAYNLYLQASNVSFSNEQRIAFLEKAVDIDSNFAEAYSILARTWLSRGGFTGMHSSEEVVKKALPLLQKALQADPNSASAHRWMGALYLWYKWDFAAAEKEYNNLKRLNPSNTGSAAGFTEFLITTGRAKEALKVTQEAVINDKNSSITWGLLAIAYYFNNNPQKSLETIKTAMSLFPKHRFLTSSAIRINTYTGNYTDAIHTFETSDTSLRLNSIPLVLGYSAAAYYKIGQKEKAENLLKELVVKSKKSPVGSPSFFTAGVYASTGKLDAAIQYLEKAYNDREVEMYWLKEEPLFRPLYSDTRFQNIVNRIGYPK